MAMILCQEEDRIWKGKFNCLFPWNVFKLSKSRVSFGLTNNFHPRDRYITPLISGYISKRLQFFLQFVSIRLDHPHTPSARKEYQIPHLPHSGRLGMETATRSRCRLPARCKTEGTRLCCPTCLSLEPPSCRLRMHSHCCTLGDSPPMGAVKKHFKSGRILRSIITGVVMSKVWKGSRGCWIKS